MLEEAKKQCDWLIVGLQNDPSETPAEYRGKKKNKPIQRLDERYIQLKANRYVDEIVTYNTEEDLYKLLLELKPDIRIIGADWQGKKFTGYDLPMKVYFNSRNHGYSTTELRERIKNAN
jgi:glycerol-3-phosphate cytidylyltransferase